MQEKVSQTILDTPVRFWLNANGLLRLFFIKKIRFSIRPLKLGTLVKISGKLAEIKVPEKELLMENPLKAGFEIAGSSADAISYCIACAILNSRITILLFAPILKNYLKWRMAGNDLQNVLAIVMEQSQINGFLNTIVSLRGLNVLSPKQQEASPNGTGGIIAPGV